LFIIDIFHIQSHAGTENGADIAVIGSTKTQKDVTTPQKFQVHVNGLIGMLNILMLVHS
jgi:hypothetical protein